MDQVDLVTLAGAGAFYLVVLLTGFIAAKIAISRGSGTSTESAANQVMVGYRNFGWIVSIATMTASWIGATAICAGAERTYTSGMISGAIPSFSMSLSLLFGGLLIAKKLRVGKYVTIIDPFQSKYGKKVGVLFVFSAFIGETLCCGSTLSALGATLSVIAHIPYHISIVVSGLIAISYTMFGGIFSVAYTDVVQLLFVFIGTVIAVPFTLTNDAIRPINATELLLGGTKGVVSNTIITEIDTFLLIAFGSFCWQCYCQRVVATKSSKVAVLGSSISAFVGIALSCPSVIIGGVAKAVGNLTISVLISDVFKPKFRLEPDRSWRNSRVRCSSCDGPFFEIPLSEVGLFSWFRSDICRNNVIGRFVHSCSCFSFYQQHLQICNQTQCK